MAVLTCALVGCAYKPGSFAYPQKVFPGERTTVGCLDLAVDRRADLTNASVVETAAVIEYQFGNRCDHPVTIDLSRVAVVGRTVDGVEVSLRPFDPASEMRPTRLDGRFAGGEAIAYPASQPLVQVCVDVTTITPDPAEPARWICIGDVDAVAVGERKVALESQPGDAIDATPATHLESKRGDASHATSGTHLVSKAGDPTGAPATDLDEPPKVAR